VNVRLAFVLLSRPELPATDDVLEAYRRLAPGGTRLLADVSDGGGGESATFLLGANELVIVSLTRAPIPDGEAEAAARYSLASIESDWELGPHVAHLIVVHQHKDRTPSIEGLGRFTQVLGAIAQAAGAVGIYWGDARATHPTDFFVDALGQESLPVVLWTGISVATDGDERVSLLSLGLPGQLGLDDLMVTAPRADAEEALGFFLDLIAYAARRGATVPDGETVGRNEHDRIPVQVEASPIDPDKQIWRIDLD
jgi:hypothetical protein